MDLPDYVLEFFRQVERHEASLKDKEGRYIHAFTDIKNTLVFFVKYYKYCAFGPAESSGEKPNNTDIAIQLKSTLRDLVLVPFMSIVEYNTIKLAQEKPRTPAYEMVQKKGERKVYLSDLIPLIPEMAEKAGVWRFAIALRNDIVHFNGVARTTLESPLSDAPIQMVEGQQSAGKLSSFVRLLRELELSFYTFLRAQ